jgi:hypothetical protein
MSSSNPVFCFAVGDNFLLPTRRFAKAAVMRVGLIDTQLRSYSPYRSANKTMAARGRTPTAPARIRIPAGKITGSLLTSRYLHIQSN